VLLFVKYVSDKYARVPFALITIPEGASFADMVALKGKSDIGDQINKKIIAPLAIRNLIPRHLQMRRGTAFVREVRESGNTRGNQFRKFRIDLSVKPRKVLTSIESTLYVATPGLRNSVSLR
jgi:hypothetical protein